jgi:hypothetical protein
MNLSENENLISKLQKRCSHDLDFNPIDIHKILEVFDEYNDDEKITFGDLEELCTIYNVNFDHAASILQILTFPDINILEQKYEMFDEEYFYDDISFAYKNHYIINKNQEKIYDWYSKMKTYWVLVK